MFVIEEKTLGAVWLRMMERICREGKACSYTDNAGEEFAVRELLGFAVTVTEPSWPDAVIETYQNAEEFEWMRKNFLVKGKVKELHLADSYATRFYDYMGQKDQIEWVIRRLKEETRLRSAAITTFEPLKDEKYIPCVSLLDFMITEDRLELLCYCRALDMGTKAYANLALLYLLQKQVAEALGLPTGKMTLFVKSAHVYEKNLPRVRQILSEAGYEH